MSRNRHLWVLAGIIAGAAIIRFATLGHQSYDHDEAVTAWRVLHPTLGATMHVVAHTERSPPLYYLLAWLWSKLFGVGEVGLRSLSALFGTLTIPAAYLAGREFASRRAGLIAAGLVAVNPYLIWYSQEARSYALFALLSAWALYFFARALRDHSPRTLALWALASSLALCSHYFAVFLIIPEGLLLIRAVRPRAPAIAALAVQGAVGLALVPLAIAQEQAGPANLFRLHPLAVRAGQALLDFVSSVEPSPLTGGPVVDAVQALAGLGATALAVATIVILVRRGRQRERRAALRVAVVFALSFGLPVALAVAGLDFVEPRKVLIGSVFPLLVLVAIGLGSRNAGRVGVVGALAAGALFAGVVGAVYGIGQMQRPDWRAAAAAIGPAHQPRVLVVASSGQVPLGYYLHATNFGPHGGLGRIQARVIDTLGQQTYAATPPLPGFRLVSTKEVAESFWIRRYTASRPRLISAQQVSGSRILGEPSLKLANRVPGATYAARSGGSARPFGARSSARIAHRSSGGSSRRSSSPSTRRGASVPKPSARLASSRHRERSFARPRSG